MKDPYAQVKSPKFEDKALAQIETEPEIKHRKKYAGVWKTKKSRGDYSG